MSQRVTAIPFGGFVGVNAYLLEQDGAFVLVDTGLPRGRTVLLDALDAAGCKPGDLRLIVVTHADPDHTGSVALVRDRFVAPVAMHEAEVAAAEIGAFRGNRASRRGPVVRALLRLVGLAMRIDRFSPDVLVSDGFALTPYGVDATLLHTPGHSLGSIAVITAEHDLVSGDLLENRTSPAAGSIVDDASARDTSIERLRGLGIRTVYPGHGAPFAMSDLPAASA